MSLELRKKIVLLMVFMTIGALVFASQISYSAWTGAKATSTYSVKPLFGVSVNDEFFNVTLEQVGDVQTRLYTGLTFENNKTLRQNLFFNSNYTYNEGLDFIFSYLIGQDLKASVFYFDYRIGLQLGINYSIPTHHGQLTVSPTLILDTGLAFKYITTGIKLTSITETESSLQTLPIISPYLGLNIGRFTITLGPEIKLANYSFDRIYPVISTSGRVGVKYTGGATK